MFETDLGAAIHCYSRISVGESKRKIGKRRGTEKMMDQTCIKKNGNKCNLNGEKME